jgi:emfourin
LKIVLRKWGGFTGKAGAEVHEVPVDSLSPDEALRLKQMVDGAHFFGLPDRLVKSAPQPWDFRHSLTVEDGGKSKTVEFHEDAVSPEMTKLVGEVKRLGGGPSDP